MAATFATFSVSSLPAAPLERTLFGSSFGYGTKKDVKVVSTGETTRFFEGSTLKWLVVVKHLRCDLAVSTFLGRRLGCSTRTFVS